MEITINLSASEVSGIKQYLKNIGGITNPNKQDVTNYIDSVVQAIHSPKEAVSHYIKLAEKSISHD